MGRSTVKPPVVLIVVLLSMAASGGCGLLSGMLYAVRGEKVPAEYAEFKNKKVAVVAVSDTSPYRDDDVAARMLARQVSETLQTEVKKIELIDEDEIDKWRDSHGWDNTDYAALGKGVGADQVLVIEIADMRLRDGATLYKGRAAVTTTVYDVATGKRPFRRHLEEFTYPVTTGQYTSETTEPRFRRTFIMMLAQRVSRYFYDYNYEDTFALDAKIASS